MEKHGALLCLSLIVALFLLAGCGSSSTPGNPGPPPPPPGSPPPPPPPPNSSAITGQVVDAQTHMPIVGTVAVALESGPGDFHVVSRTTADAQGRFAFNNVSAGVYALVFGAVSTQGAVYVPAIMVSGGNTPFGPAGTVITTGSNVGTVSLTAATATETFAGTATSQSSAGGPAPITISFDIPAFVADFIFVVPGTSGSVTTQPANAGCTMNVNVACANFSVLAPAQTAFFGVFNPPNSNLQVFAGAPVYGLHLNAFSLAGAPDCSPSTQSTGVTNVSPGGTTTVGEVAFTGCQ